MEIWFKIIIAGLCGSAISALVTYFMSTRNMDTAMRRVTKEFMEDHLEKDHTNIMGHDATWKVAKQAIKEHVDTCGKDLKQDVKDLERKVDSVVLIQVRHNTEIKSMNGTLKAIARKMNIIIVDEGE